MNHSKTHLQLVKPAQKAHEKGQKLKLPARSIIGEKKDARESGSTQALLDGPCRHAESLAQAVAAPLSRSAARRSVRRFEEAQLITAEESGALYAALSCAECCFGHGVQVSRRVHHICIVLGAGRV